jgi:transposase
VLTEEERKTLVCWSRGRRTQARLVLRARIVLLAAVGKMNKDIAREVGTSQETVGRWRLRFARKRLPGLEKDAPRSGRRPTVREAVAQRIVKRTTQSVPANATHWSVRTLAKELGVSRSMVHRIWQANQLKPHLTRAT